MSSPRFFKMSVFCRVDQPQGISPGSCLRLQKTGGNALRPMEIAAVQSGQGAEIQSREVVVHRFGAANHLHAAVFFQQQFSAT
jgi:hypothetical protein